MQANLAYGRICTSMSYIPIHTYGTCLFALTYIDYVFWQYLRTAVEDPCKNGGGNCPGVRITV